MGYFLHNKYDKSSLDQVSAMQSAGHTIIDYYGQLESGNTQYKDLDTSQMPVLVENLSYVGIQKDNFDSNNVSETNSQFKFESSLIIKSIQRGSATVSGAGTEVDIEEVNPEKVTVKFYNTSDTYFYVESILPTKIKLKYSRGTSYSGTCYFELTEFK